MCYNQRAGALAQLARASRLHREGRGFEPLATHHYFGVLAQLVERLVRNQ